MVTLLIYLNTVIARREAARGSPRIVVHSTHVVPFNIVWQEVLRHSLTTCASAHTILIGMGRSFIEFKDSRVAFHTRSIDDAVNQSSIGIELYSTTVHERSVKPFTSRQIEALANLIG